MTPQEMLIGVDLELEKVNANAISSYEVDEKLWFLNQQCLRFIKQRLRPQSNEKQLGFQADQKRYDDLESLITSATLNVYANDSNSIFTYLPANYFSLTNDRSITKDLCGATYSPATSSINVFATCYTLPTDSFDLFQTLKVYINGTIIFQVSDYFPTGIPNTSSKFELIAMLIDIINALPNFEAKYEGYLTKYCKGAIVVATTNNVTFTMKNNYTKVGPVTNFDQNMTIDTLVFTKLNSITGSKEWDNRLTKSSKHHKLLPTNFGTTFSYSPISILQQGKLIAYHNQKFILSSLNIDYIRRPRKISLSLNQSCELSEDVHDEIVTGTAKRLAGITLNDNYRNLINEDLLKE